MRADGAGDAVKCRLEGFLKVACLMVFCLHVAEAAAPEAVDLFPPRQKLSGTRPRVLLRPSDTPYAVSVKQLRSLKRDAAFKRVIDQLKRQKNAAAKALVRLCTGDTQQAQEAVSLLRSYRCPERTDTFHMYFKLMYMGLAYDWLWDFPGFTEEVKKEVRSHVAPLAARALRMTNDHMFHNYIWMAGGGLAIWAFATAGEDAEADKTYDRIRNRFNTGLFPAWSYLDGVPSEPMGYWSLYVLAPGFFTLLAGQSAAETNCIERSRRFLAPHINNLVHCVLPNLRYIPWGDLQGGPNGGVTHEMAGFVDAAAWALRSPYCAHLSGRIKKVRGLSRFYGETAMWYLIYSRHVQVEPKEPPLSFHAGGTHSGHFITRGSWDKSAAVVTLKATDHFGDHHHYDQGSFIIYREELLAVDPPVYRKVRGPQQRTDNHNTLLFGGKGQRAVRGQWFVMVADFLKNLDKGRKLETGGMLYAVDHGSWSEAAVQFAQAYDRGLVKSAVRQLLFIRPSTVVVVDHIQVPPGAEDKTVEWLLHVPAEPSVGKTSVLAEGKRSYLRCDAVLSAEVAIKTGQSDVGTWRCTFRYPGKAESTLVHVLETGDRADASRKAVYECSVQKQGVLFTMKSHRFLFHRGSEFHIEKK